MFFSSRPSQEKYAKLASCWSKKAWPLKLTSAATVWHVARHRKNSRRLNSENQSGCREQSPCSDENPLARGCCTSEEYRDGGRSCFPRHCCSWHIDGWSPSSSGNPAAAAG